MTTEDTVACKVCGEPTAMLGTQLCDPCWERERHLTPLLAAAPALLAACKRALAWYDREDDTAGDPPSMWIEQLRAAVRLAEGKAP